MHLRVM